MKILDLNQFYTFSKIFELKVEVDTLVEEFGYSFSRQFLNLPQYSGELVVCQAKDCEFEGKWRGYSLPQQIS